MYAFDFERPTTLADAAAALAAAGGQAAGRRADPAGRDEAAPGATRAAGRPRRHRGAAGIRKEGDALVIGAMTRHAEVARRDVVKCAIPALAELAGGIGDRQVREMGTSAARSPTTIRPPATRRRCWRCGATVRTNQRARSRPTTSSRACSRRRLSDGEIITAVAFPDRRSARPTSSSQQPASRFALVGVFVAQTAKGGVRVAVTGAATACSARRRSKTRSGKASRAAAAKGVKIDAGGLNSDSPRLARVPRASRLDHGIAGGRGDGVVTPARSTGIPAQYRSALTRRTLRRSPGRREGDRTDRDGCREAR